MLSRIICLSALISLASAHGTITVVRGANGIMGTGMGIDPSTPRNGAGAKPFQQDTSVIRDREIQSGKVGPCGRTTQKGALDMAAEMEAASAAGLPSATASGEIQMTLHQINQDGAGPYTCDISGDGGNTFQPAKVNKNVPGAFLGLSTATAKDFPLNVQMPAGMDCAGGPNGDACVVRCRNATPAGPFGSCAIVTKAEAGGAGAGAGAAGAGAGAGAGGARGARPGAAAAAAAGGAGGAGGARTRPGAAAAEAPAGGAGAEAGAEAGAGGARGARPGAAGAGAAGGARTRPGAGGEAPAGEAAAGAGAGAGAGGARTRPGAGAGAGAGEAPAAPARAPAPARGEKRRVRAASVFSGRSRIVKKRATTAASFAADDAKNAEFEEELISSLYKRTAPVEKKRVLRSRIVGSLSGQWI